MKILQDKNLTLTLLNIFVILIPFSFVIGNFAINLNIFLIIILGTIRYKSKLFKISINDLHSILLTLFFVFLILTSIFNYFQSSYEENIIKSFLYLRYLFLTIILSHMVKIKEFNFKFFFTSAIIISFILSLDILFQYTTGKDLFNYQTKGGVYNSGFFGDELIAGSFILRFLFLSIFCLIFFYKFKERMQPIVFCSIFLIGFMGMVLSGNRMPVIMISIVILLSLFFLPVLRKKIITSTILCLLFFYVLLNINSNYHLKYSSFAGNAQNIIIKFPEYIKKNLFKQKKSAPTMLGQTVEKKEERINIGSGHFALYLTAFDVWKDSVLIGGGIKSFRINCTKKSKGDPSKYQTNRYCDAHPHHYYLEILTDTGLIGLMLLLLILYQLLIKKLFIIRKMNNTNKIIFISLIICLAVELFPLRSSGSFFSTANASYIFILIGLISKFNENEKA